MEEGPHDKSSRPEGGCHSQSYSIPAGRNREEVALPPCLLVLVPSIGQAQAAAAAPRSSLPGHRVGQRKQRESFL